MSPEVLKRAFQTALAKLRLELLSNIDQIDVLDKDKVRSTLDLFNQRLILAQHEYLQYLSQAIGNVDAPNSDFELQSTPPTKIPEFAATALAGSSAAILVNLISFTSTSWLFFTTTSSAATLLGGMAGVSAGIATAGIGAAAGVTAGLAINRGLKNRRRRRIKEAILAKYDTAAVPQLENWADNCIATALRR